MEPERATTPGRTALWAFTSLFTIRNSIIRRAGRLVRPNGVWVLTMNANRAAQEDIERYLSAA
jgi:hypothetical protein